MQAWCKVQAMVPTAESFGVSAEIIRGGSEVRFHAAVCEDSAGSARAPDGSEARFRRVPWVKKERRMLLGVSPGLFSEKL